MTRTTFTAEVTDAQAQVLRHVLAFMDELDHLADTAADGTVLDACEAAVLSGGRNVQRHLLQQAVQRRIDTAEKKGHRSESATVAEPKTTAGGRPVSS